MFVRSAALNEGIRLRASLFALGVRRAQTGAKVRVVEEAIEGLGEVSEMQSAAGDSGGTSFSSPIPCRFKCTLTEARDFLWRPENALRTFFLAPCIARLRVVEETPDLHIELSISAEQEATNCS